jgi:hypothetical protein
MVAAPVTSTASIAARFLVGSRSACDAVSAPSKSRPRPLHDQEDADQSPVPRIEDCRPPSGPHVGTDRVGGVPVDGRKGVMGIQGQPGHQQGHEHQGRCTTDPTAPPALPIATVVGDDPPVFQRSLAWSRTRPRPRPPNTPPIVAQSVRLPTARGRATRGHPDPIEISPRAGLPGGGGSAHLAAGTLSG